MRVFDAIFFLPKVSLFLASFLLSVCLAREAIVDHYIILQSSMPPESKRGRPCRIDEL